MPKERRPAIMEKLSALKPSEPTKTRGRVVKSSTKKVPLKKDLVPQNPQLTSGPQRDIPPPEIAMFVVPGETMEIHRIVCKGWFQIAHDCHRMFISSLADFMDPGRWRRS